MLEGKSLLELIYLHIQDRLAGHSVELPLRTRDLDNLGPTKFCSAVYDMIKASDAVITVLAAQDQSGPGEAVIASTLHKPQCIMEMSGSAPRLLQGLPHVVGVTKIKPGDLGPQVSEAIDRLLRDLLSR